jgi:surfactin synthase thioesterase subunit
VAFAAEADSFVSARAMQEWSRATRGTFTLKVLPGNHFYPHEAGPRQRLLQELAQCLGGFLAASRDPGSE